MEVSCCWHFRSLAEGRERVRGGGLPRNGGRYRTRSDLCIALVSPCTSRCARDSSRFVRSSSFRRCGGRSSMRIGAVAAISGSFTIRFKQIIYIYSSRRRIAKRFTAACVGCRSAWRGESTDSCPAAAHCSLTAGTVGHSRHRAPSAPLSSTCSRTSRSTVNGSPARWTPIHRPHTSTVSGSTPANRHSSSSPPSFQKLCEHRVHP